MTSRVHITATDESLSANSAGGMTAHAFLTRAIERVADRGVTLADDPDDADLVIFAESHKDPKPGQPDASTRVGSHPVYRQHTHKCVIHNGADRPKPTIPGLYPSIPRQWAQRLGCVGAPYLAQLNPFLDELLPDERTPTLTAAFMGSCARKPLRQRLHALAQSPAWDNIVFEDTTDQFVGSLRNNNTDAHAQLKRRFVEQILSSRFVLCPAGAGPSSYRLFEAMMCARAPVIIGNRWTPPPGPDWDACAIIVPATQAADLPRILADHEDRWQEMGENARAQWERHYHPDVIGAEFVRLAKLVLDMRPHQSASRRFAARVYSAGPAKTANIRASLNRRFARG